MLVLLALCIVMVGAVSAVLNSDLKDKLIHDIIGEYVDGNLEYGRVKLSLLKSFPNLYVGLYDVSLTYPSDRFEGYRVRNDEGRCADVDTLLSIALIETGITFDAVRWNKDFHLLETHIHKMRAFLHSYDSTSANWNIFKTSSPPKDTVKKGSFLDNLALEEIKLDGLCVEDPYVVYDDAVSGLYAVLDFDDLELKAQVKKKTGGLYLNVDTSLDSLSMETLAAIVVPIETKAKLSLHFACDGFLNTYEKRYPEAILNVSVPRSGISYPGIVKDGVIQLDASAMLSRGVLDVYVPDFQFNMEALGVEMFASVKDVLNPDPLCGGEVNAHLDSKKLLEFLPDSVDFFSANGSVNAKVSGEFRPSLLQAKDIWSSKLRLELTSDSLDVKDYRDSVSAYIRNMDVRLASMESLIEKGAPALGLKVSADSLSAIYKDNISVFASALNAALQGTHSEAVDSVFKIQPMIAELKAGHLFMKNTDSLEIGVDKTFNKISITPQIGEGGIRSPLIAIESKSGGIIYNTNEYQLSVDGVQMSFNEQRSKPRARRASSNRSSRAGRPVSDFLTDEDFRTHDIKLSVNDSLVKWFEKWSADGKLAVDSAKIYIPSLQTSGALSDVRVEFVPRKLTLNHLYASLGDSDLTLFGELLNLSNLIRGRGMVDLKLDVLSEKLNLDEILSLLPTGKTVADTAVSTAGSLIVVPANLNAKVTVDAQAVNFSTIDMFGMHSDLSMKERCLQFVNTVAGTPMGSVELNGFYSTKNKRNISAGISLGLFDVTADRVIEIVPAINELFPVLKSFKGNLNCEASATTQLDTNMNVILPTVSGVFKIAGKDLEVDDLGGMSSLARRLKFKDPDHLDVDSMAVTGIITDNQLQVFPFILSVDRYVLALAGEQVFGNNFSYHISAITSPLPFKIGVDIFGDDFNSWRWRLSKPRFKNIDVPVFTSTIQDMQVNLLSSIRNVFSKGVERAMDENESMGYRLEQEVERRKLIQGSEQFSFDEAMEIETYMISQEVEEEAASLSAEIEKLF